MSIQTPVRPFDLARFKLPTRCHLLLITAALTACGQASTETPTSTAAATAIESPAVKTPAVKTINFSFGGERLDIPINLCTISPAFVAVYGKRDETTVEVVFEGRAKVNYMDHFEREGIRYWNQWDSRRDDMEYAINGRTVTASGTMKNTNRWKQGTKSGWTNVTGSNPLDDQAYTFEASCD